MSIRSMSVLFVLILLGLAACGGTSQSAPTPVRDTAAINTSAADTTYSSRGNATKGKVLFTPCSSCHTTTTERLVGPGLAGLFSEDGPILPNGVDYNGKLPNGKERTESNIADWIRTGGQGQIGYMNPHTFDDQQMADLMAYLRTLKP